MHGSCGSIGAWVTCVKFLRGLRGSRCFIRGSTFDMGHKWVALVIYFCIVQIFSRGSFLCLGQIFLGGEGWGGRRGEALGLKNLNWSFHNNISVAH